MIIFNKNLFWEKMSRNHQVYVGEEHGKIALPVADVMLDGELNIFKEIESQGIFQLRFTGTKLEFFAGKYIGIIPINPHLTIEVRPRVPVKNLVRCLKISRSNFKELRGLKRLFDSSKDSFDALLDTLTEDLLEAVERIRYFGIYKTYSKLDIVTSHPKGRINLSAAAKESFKPSKHEKIHCTWFDRTINNPPNQCILTALESLAQKYACLIGQKMAQSRLRRINEASQLFHGVKSDFRHSFFFDSSIEDPSRLPELRSYYRDAIQISKLILQNEGISVLESGTQFSMSSLIIDMSVVFEKYIRNVLTDSLNDNNLSVRDGNISHEASGGARPLFIDEAHSQSQNKKQLATPDIVVFNNNVLDPKPYLVIDAKYKIVASTAEREDINQIVTYAVAYGVDKALLIMPAHPGIIGGLHILGRVGTVQVYQFNFDLSAEDVSGVESEWVTAVREICTVFSNT